jgi:hypothetical protein
VRDTAIQQLLSYPGVRHPHPRLCGVVAGAISQMGLDGPGHRIPCGQPNKLSCLYLIRSGDIGHDSSKENEHACSLHKGLSLVKWIRSVPPLLLQERYCQV